MNKQEFVENLAERGELSKAEAGRVLDAILDSLTQAMADGEDVRFTGFGTFSSQRRRARDGVNPQDPTQKIRIRAAHVPKFKAGTSLREAVSEVAATAGGTSKASRNGRQDANVSSASAREPAAARGNAAGWIPLGRR